MTKIVRVASKIVKGFEARVADAETYKAVAEGIAERFGADSRVYATIMGGINVDKGTGSQFFFNTEADLYLPEGERVATLNDLRRIKDAEPSFFGRSCYTDTTELVLRTATPLFKNNAEVLEHLVRQAQERELEFSLDNPLVLSGLELTRDDNSDNYYGILLNITDATKTENDARFACLINEQGLSGIYYPLENGKKDYYDNIHFTGSDGGGRVVVFAPQAQE